MPNTLSKTRSGHTTEPLKTRTGMVSIGEQTCYMNGLMRILFQNCGDLNNFLKKNVKENEIIKFQSELQSLWLFLGNKKKKPAYEMKKFFKLFTSLESTLGSRLGLDWKEQQSPIDFFDAIVELAFDKDAIDLFHVECVNEYSTCNVCKQQQDPRVDGNNYKYVTIGIVNMLKRDGTPSRNYKTDIQNCIDEFLNKDDIEKIQCSYCIGDLESKISNDTVLKLAKEQVPFSRIRTGKTNIRIPVDQQYVIVSIPKSVSNPQKMATKTWHIRFLSDSIHIPYNGTWTLESALLYTGKSAGNESSGHYYYMNERVVCDDENEIHDSERFIDLKKNGFDVYDKSGTKGYVNMLVLKRKDKSSGETRYYYYNYYSIFCSNCYVRSSSSRSCSGGDGSSSNTSDSKRFGSPTTSRGIILINISYLSVLL